MTSGSVIVSWSPPAAGDAEVTGYRIYYTFRGVLTNVGFASTEHQYQFDLGGVLSDDMMLSILAESVQLPSELIKVTINTEIITTTAEELATTTAIAATTMATSQTTSAQTTKEPTTTGGEVDTTTPIAPTSTADVMVTTQTERPMTINDDDMPATTTGVLTATSDGLPHTMGMIKEGIDLLLIITIVEGIIIIIMAIILILIAVAFLHWR